MQGKHILIGVTGGIAAYKTAYLIRDLVKRGAEVKVIMTEKAKALRMEFESKFGPLTAEASRDMEYWNWLDDPWPWENQRSCD